MFISTAVNNLVSGLDVGKRPGGTLFIPSRLSLHNIDTRVGNESLRAWFTRCVGIHNPYDFCIEDHIAIFGVQKWNKAGLCYLNLQALIAVEGTIADLLLPDTADNCCHYYRLEYDPSKLGPMFKEPLPHVHVLPDGAPRFQFSGSGARTLIVDFIEFLYLNYSYTKWEDWAKITWKGRVAPSPPSDPFDAIVAAYAGGRYEELSGRYRESVEALKNALRAEKRDVCRGLAALPDIVDMLSYR